MIVYLELQGVQQGLKSLCISLKPRSLCVLQGLISTNVLVEGWGNQ